MKNATIDNGEEIKTSQNLILKMQSEIDSGELLKEDIELKKSLIQMHRDKIARLEMLPKVQTVNVPTKTKPRAKNIERTIVLKPDHLLNKQSRECRAFLKEGCVEVLPTIKEAITKAGLTWTRSMRGYMSKAFRHPIRRERFTLRASEGKRPRFFLKAEHMKLMLPEFVEIARKRFVDHANMTREQILKAEGRCYNCGAHELAPGKFRCIRCRATKAAYENSLKLKKSA